MTRTDPPSFSTKVARSLPRLSASMPPAPVPAKRSRKTQPGPTAPSASRVPNSDSLTRSVSARVAGPAGARRVPLALPPMTRPPSATAALAADDFARADPLCHRSSIRIRAPSTPARGGRVHRGCVRPAGARRPTTGGASRWSATRRARAAGRSDSGPTARPRGAARDRARPGRTRRSFRPARRGAP